MKDRRSKLEIKTAAAKRLLMWHFMRIPLNLVLLSEFPKSGGSWVGQMLSDAMELPFPRNISPKLERCIMHGHHRYSPRFGKMLGVIRDGRDVMVSAYYHFLFENDRNPEHSIDYHRSRVPFSDYDDIKTNLPQFIEYMFTDFSSGRFHLSWSDYVDDYLDNPKVALVRYENLLKRPHHELERILNFLNFKNYNSQKIDQVVYKYSFKNLSKRTPGQTNNRSFLRKGIAGDWKNHFTEASRDAFNKYAGMALIKADYVEDLNWL